jgi:hypothetical protein
MPDPVDRCEAKLDAGMFAHLDQALGKLTTAVVRKIARAAATKALRPVVACAKRKCHKRTGTLRKSLGIVQKTYGRTGIVYAVVGPRTGFKDPATGENPINIAHLIEDGVKPHLIAPKGGRGALKIQRGVGPTVIVEGAVQHPGYEAKPFIRPAYDECKDQMIAITQEAAGGAIMAEVDRLKGPTT